MANGLFTALRTSFVQSSFSGTGNLEEPGQRRGLPAPDARCEALLLELQRRGVGGKVVDVDARDPPAVNTCAPHTTLGTSTATACPQHGLQGGFRCWTTSEQRGGLVSPPHHFPSHSPPIVPSSPMFEGTMPSFSAVRSILGPRHNTPSRQAKPRAAEHCCGSPSVEVLEGVGAVALVAGESKRVEGLGGGAEVERRVPRHVVVLLEVLCRRQRLASARPLQRPCLPRIQAGWMRRAWGHQSSAGRSARRAARRSRSVPWRQTLRCQSECRPRTPAGPPPSRGPWLCGAWGRGSR